MLLWAWSGSAGSHAQSVIIETNVESAAVLVDGARRGRTDANGQAFVEGLSAGTHTIGIEKPGYQPTQKSISVQEGLTQTLTFALQPEPETASSGLLVEGTPGATVVINGQASGTTDGGGSAYFPDLEPGRYQVALRKEGYQPASRRLFVDGSGLDQTVQIRLRPTRSEPAARQSASAGDTANDAASLATSPNSAQERPAEEKPVADEASAGPAKKVTANTETVSGNRTTSGESETSRLPTDPDPEPVPGSEAEAAKPESKDLAAGTAAAGTAESRGGSARSNESRSARTEAALLNINTNVGGASVYVDGSYRTQTTSQGSASLRLAPGHYRVSVAKSGFSNLERATQLKPGNARTVRFILDRASGSATAQGRGGDNLTLMLAVLLVSAIGAVAVVLVVLVRRDAGAQQKRASGASQVTGTFDRYRLQRKLGRGGMATVYLAEDSLDNRLVALKVLDLSHMEDQDLMRKFIKEGEALKRINESHPEAPVVQAYRVGYEKGATQGRPFVALEYIEGTNLLTYMKQRGTLEASDALCIIRQVCEGLEAAHHNQIWHRDITPDNVIVVKEQPDFEVKLIDFGVAKHEYTSQGTMDGSIMGKPPYMSPEQCRNGAIDGRSDVYSAGILLYTLLTGEPPYTDDNPLQVMRMHEEAPVPELPAHLPETARKLFRQMTQKDPDARPTAAEVARSVTIILTSA